MPSTTPGRRLQLHISDRSPFIDQQHRTKHGRLDVRQPGVAQRVRARPAIVRAEWDTEEMPDFTVEIGEASLWSREDALPARKLFPGIFAAVRHVTLKRAGALVDRLQAGPTTRDVHAKMATLQHMVASGRKSRKR